jgi:hypothetical protein
MDQQQSSVENELRMMIGDLFLQLAMARAEIARLNSPPPPPEPQIKTNGGADADHRPEPG